MIGSLRVLANDPPYAGGEGDGWSLLQSSNYPVGFGLTSQEDQAFAANDSATEISPIFMMFTTGNLPTASSDIRIIIPPTLAMTWDTTDTTATFGGNATDKVSNSVSFESDNKVLVINVTTDLANDDTLELTGLNFANFTAVTKLSRHLAMCVDNDGTAEATDPTFKSIFRDNDPTNQYGTGYGDGWSMAESANFILESHHGYWAQMPKKAVHQLQLRHLTKVQVQLPMTRLVLLMV